MAIRSDALRAMAESDQRACERLLVIIPDRLSALVAKGEVVERYYNPGELFDEVHLLLLNDDAPDPAAVQPMVGRARLVLHNLPPFPRMFVMSLGWQPILLRPWLARGLDLAARIRPSLVRTHNNFLEGYLAREIKRRLGIPYVTSLHGVWDRDRGLRRGLREAAVRLCRRKLERATLVHADAVIAVYQPIIRYAERLGARNIHLIYNAVSNRIGRKDDYVLSEPPRLVTVNRQVTEKNPENIIRAVAGLDCRYTIVGDGPLHEHLERVAQESGAADKITFVRAIPNERLCRMLSEFDLMVSHCDYWGISKGVLEAGLAGLPIVLNRHPVEPIPDCEGGWLRLCDNSPEGYRSAIRDLLDDERGRRALGEAAYRHAMSRFDPEAMEQKVAGLYRSVLRRAR